MSRLIHILIPSLMLVAALACSDRPDNIIDHDTMAKILADIHKGEGVIQSNQRHFTNDSVKRLFRQSIYDRHGVTSDDFYSSLDWYGYHVEEFDEIYNTTIAILEDELEKAQSLAGSAAELNASAASTSMDGDSINVWRSERYRRFSSNMPTDHMSFSLRSDRFWDKGDVYIFRGKFSGVKAPVDYVMTVEYQDGTKEYMHERIAGGGWHEVGIAMNPERKANIIYGYVMCPTTERQIAMVDSITLTRTRWGGHYNYLRDKVKSYGKK
ncbi:MAG: DUF4296 domain-containing protein [Paramuribaculum sp.]|nr:DUF4296 domain-containing protein [Paramuribaculum sp.]